MNKKPLISIIVRTYNASAFVEHALKSLAIQTLDQSLFETIAIDDGSTDDTLLILNKYKDILKIVKQPHVGLIRALNKGIKLAKGTYVGLLDADDTIKQNMLSEIEKAVKKHPKVAFVYSDYYEKDLETGDIKTVSLKDNFFATLAGNIFFRRDVLKEMGRYDERLIFPEYDLLLKILDSGQKGFHIPKPLYVYSRTAQSFTAKKERVVWGKKQLTKKYGNRKEIQNIRDY
jgi:glycosyltransferase involved in cell wall biosynthesis